MRVIARVTKIILRLAIGTAFMFDVYLISLGIVAMMQGKPFLQGIVKTLQNMRMVWLTFLLSLLASGYTIYLGAKGQSH